MSEHLFGLIKRKLLSFYSGQIGKSTIWISIALLTRALIQAGYLIFLSRLMGAEQYGLFAGYVSVVMLAYPLAGWGISYLVIEKLSGGIVSSQRIFATSLKQIIVIAILLVALMLFCSSFFFGDQVVRKVALLLCISEFLFVPIASVALNFCLVVGRGINIIIMMCAIPIFRLLSLIAFDGSYVSFIDISELYFLGSMIGACISFFILVKMIGWPDFTDALAIRESFLAGGRYVATTLTGNASQEIDKIMVMQFLGAAVLGVYSVAYRIASLLTLPVAALSNALLPRLFSSKSKERTNSLIKISILCSILYGIFAGAALWCISPFVLQIFGSQFAEAASLAAPFAVWLGIFSIKTIFCTILTGVGLQLYRTLIEACSLIFLCLSCLLLLPFFGVKVAVFALIVSDLFIILCAFIVERKNGRKISSI